MPFVGLGIFIKAEGLSKHKKTDFIETICPVDFFQMFKRSICIWPNNCIQTFKNIDIHYQNVKKERVLTSCQRWLCIIVFIS